MNKIVSFSLKHLLVLTLTTLSLSLVAFNFRATAQGSGGNNFFGGIFSSTGDGTTVNQNIFATKPEVYLNGGPQNQNSAGLPDGSYYFQVTDPSGSTLLSTDNAVCRQVLVVGGVVKGADPSSPCPHANGTQNPTTGAIPVQLIPFNDTPNNGGEYKVHLIRKTANTRIDLSNSAVIIFDSRDSKTDNFKVERSACTSCNSVTQLRGKKFYDADADSLMDSGEVGVADVRIAISVDGGAPVIIPTSLDGTWSYDIPSGSTYKVCEILPNTCLTNGSYWVQTMPRPDNLGEQCYTGTATGDNVTGLDFGNICFVPARGGLTLGFWSNKNGEAILRAKDNYADALLFLRNLNLKKTADGSDFDPTTYPQFRTWLLSGNAVNMAYMLSVQLSATALDVKYNFLNPATIVDARSLGLGFVRIGDLILAANTELNLPGGNLTFTGNPLRKDQEIIKNALDAINNNRLPFAAGAPCGVCYPL